VSSGGGTGPAFGAPALSPVALIERAAALYADRPAYVDGERSFSYAELIDRSRRFGGLIGGLGVGAGEVVSVLAPNTNLALEAHLGSPVAGSVLNALNIRLGAAELREILVHAESKALIVDRQWESLGRQAACGLPISVIVDSGTGGEYEDLLAKAPAVGRDVEDEWSLVALNYTSGTTGRPKGVMYAHRGAYLQALAMVSHLRLDSASVFLWTLPMFHCNGWCFPWAVTAVGGKHVGLRKVDPVLIWRAIREDGVTHFNAAPTVLSALAYHGGADDGPCPQRVHVATGGAPPAPALLERLDGLGFEVTHLYGLTETYGPAVICEQRPGGMTVRARQGVANLVSQAVRVVDEHGTDVPGDGRTVGEVVLRGNNVMLGYLHDEAATAAASTADGWFRTGDLGVLHDDGYLELTDRAKDVIISGGENIASTEVEQVLADHPAVLESAVVGAPDSHWGEVPVAFVTLRPGADATEVELIEHVRTRLASFKAPRRVVLGALPKTATGKIQKFELRRRLSGGESR